jgi:hypothetical protein
MPSTGTLRYTSPIPGTLDDDSPFSRLFIAV